MKSRRILVGLLHIFIFCTSISLILDVISWQLPTHEIRYSFLPKGFPVVPKIPILKPYNRIYQTTIWTFFNLTLFSQYIFSFLLQTQYHIHFLFYKNMTESIPLKSLPDKLHFPYNRI